MNKTIEAVLRLSAKLGNLAAFDKLSGKLTDVDKKAKRFNRSQGMIARGTAEMGLVIGRYAGPAAIAGGLIAGTKAAANFEDALFNIEKKSGATADQMKTIREEIFELGKELPVSIDEIASAFERGAAAGIPMDELKDFARLSAKVADAWDMSAASVGNAFAGFEKGMGIARKDMEVFADAINYLADSGISDEADIVGFLDRVGASAKNIGLTAKETAALGTAMINLKMPAEVAARAADTLFGKLAAPENLSDKSRAALEGIVGDIEKFQGIMAKDAKGGLLYFLERLEGMTGQQRTSLLGALMGEGFDDEVTRLVGGLDEVRKNLKLVQNAAAYEGSIAILSEKRMKLFNQQLAISKNLLKEIGVEAGGIVLPWANEGLKQANDAVAYQAAATRAHREAGRGFWDATMWNTTASDLDKDRLAMIGGYTGQTLEAKSRLDREALGLGGPSGRGGRRRQGSTAAAPFAAVASPREAEQASMQALRSDPNGIADAIDMALASGGQRAATKIADGGDAIGKGGEQAGQAITAAAEAIRQAGKDAATSIRSAIKTAPRAARTDERGVGDL